MPACLPLPTPARLLAIAVASAALLLVGAPPAAAKREIPVGLYNVNNVPMRYSGDRLGLRFVVDKPTTLHRFFIPFNLEGADGVCCRQGYGDGNAGTVWLRIVKAKADGTPDMSQVLAEERVGALQRMHESDSAYGNTAHFLYFNTGGIEIAPNTPYIALVANSAADPARNWFSVNLPVAKATRWGPTGATTPTPRRRAPSPASTRAR